MATGQKVGLSTAAQELKDILEKTGFNMKKLGSVEKLDIFELINTQLLYQLENRGKTKLKLKELVNVLQKESMDAKDGCPKQAMVKVRELIARERRRLGKSISPDEEPEYFEDQLALIPTSEVYDVFQELAALQRKPTTTSEPGSVQRERSRSRSRSRAKALEDDSRAKESVIGRVCPATAAETDKSGKQEDEEDDGPIPLREQGILARIDPNAIQQHLPVLNASPSGASPQGKRLPVRKIRGIAKDISRRLKRIGITDVSQIARMTEQIAEDVAKAIRYFPKRIQQDHWVWQAERIVAGKEWIVNPEADPKFTTSGKSQYITKTYIQYERDLIDIARHYGGDQSSLRETPKPTVTLNKEVAECLWFSAMDGREITPTEKLTLRHIMEHFTFDEDAKAYLASKPEIGLQAVGA